MSIPQVPISHRMVDVYAGANRTRHVNCTWSAERGFFEPITNISFKDVGLTVTDWHYSPMALWAGARVFHRKRGSEYTVHLIVTGVFLDRAKDGDDLDISLLDLIYDIKPARVLIQKSTENHSPEWAIYENDEGMMFVRPLSEFTEDRFKILTNGA